MGSRRLGISGAQRPAKKSLGIVPSQFDIGGMVGQFDRQYAKAFELTRPEDLSIIFGERNANFFGFDAAEGFFANAGGGSLWIKSHVGNTGSAVDAVVAFLTKNDAGSNPSIKFRAGYQGEAQYGSAGNRTAFKITQGYRYETTLSAAALIAATTLELDAIGDVKVGDLIEVAVAGPAIDTRKVQAINESAGTVVLTTGISAAASSGATFKVKGFRIQTALKSRSGVVSEVERDLGAVFCSPEAEVVDYYYANVHANNRWIITEDQNSASTLANRFIANSSDWEYLATGADGTSPSTSAHWVWNNTALNNLPFRIFFNPETTLESYYEDMDVYLKNRDRTDFPIMLVTTAANEDFEDLRSAGRRLQRSELRLLIEHGTWYEITDPFTSSPLAPARRIPSQGHNTGVWIRTQRDRGVHYSPSTPEAIVRGIIGVVNNEDWSDTQRTQLFDASVNITQKIPGIGFQIRNWVTVSTLREYKYGHTLLQQNFYRESVKESLRGIDNEPNVAKRVQNGKDAITGFMQNQWRQGSGGRTPEGETFGQYLKEDDSYSTFDDSVEIIGDVRNNPKASLENGQRDYDIFFKSPTPTGSVEIGVGIIL